MQKLQFSEWCGLDPARLERLYRENGDREADRMVCEATETVALALARTARAHRRGDLTGVAAQAVELAQAAHFVGLPKLQRVAIDVARCARSGGGPALDATLARLSRLGDTSLTAIWDPRDIVR